MAVRFTDEFAPALLLQLEMLDLDDEDVETSPDFDLDLENFTDAEDLVLSTSGLFR